MNIINYRIDDRLVHGCVATMWIPNLGIERVICIDDESANNMMLKNALRLATPKNCFLSVLTHEKAIENFKTDRYGDQPVMVVSKSPETFLQLVQNGIPVPSITFGNLGNIRKTKDSVTVSKYITINDYDEKIIDELHKAGVAMEARLQPKDEVINDFYSVIQLKRNEERGG